MGKGDEMKDWEYYKQEFRREKIEEIEHNFEIIDEQFDSPIEKIVYLYLIDRFNPQIFCSIMKLETQKKIGNYRCDFYLEHKVKKTDKLIKIVIECDGHEWHEKSKKQAAHDKKRDRYMVLQGYTILRYTGSEITNNPETVIEDIVNLIVKDHK